MIHPHGNISVFVPHIGCPHRCSFCDQNAISGVSCAPSGEDVAKACRTAMEKRGSENFELAFFGGSFTAIDKDYMIELLESAQPFIGSFLMGIRISTRPDFIDENILKLLKKYNVTSIELGSQSMCDDVLLANLRGHCAQDTKKASRLIKDFGFSLGLQMMTGLYMSSYEKDIETAEEIIKLKPDTVRIYPTITIKNTYLAKLFEQGIYTPMSLEETLDMCAKLVIQFSQQDIKVIKVGLHPSKELEEKMVAGPYHQAFGEMVSSRIMLHKIAEQIKDFPTGDICVSVSKGETSKFIGQKRQNMLYLKELGYNVKIFEDENQKPLSPTIRL